ncbi:MAG: hypothetical protein K6C40_05725 [Thermoguttaceae bacterium]|nr:hypothetical protein [Thermoguttaceae bacterium]
MHHFKSKKGKIERHRPGLVFFRDQEKDRPQKGLTNRKFPELYFKCCVSSTRKIKIIPIVWVVSIVTGKFSVQSPNVAFFQHERRLRLQMFPKIIIFGLPCRSNIVANVSFSEEKNTKKAKFNEFNENKQKNEPAKNAQIAKFFGFYLVTRRNSGIIGPTDTINAIVLSRSTISILQTRTTRRLKPKYKTNKTGKLAKTNILERIAKWYTECTESGVKKTAC